MCLYDKKDIAKLDSALGILMRFYPCLIRKIYICA
jgi:hypothetical protein